MEEVTRLIVDILPELLGSSPAIQAVRERVRHLLRAWSSSRRPPPVLVQGETGTGKGLLARALHAASPRAGGPFIDLNCAAIPETMLEAELFGYERGAFTDARQSKPGLFQLAHGGALLLDEIGLLPPALQAKLLSVLEERAVRRLGATRAEPADVWIIAATNEDLAAAQRERRFRADLYHRIAVVSLVLPPVRARGDDALLLAECFLSRSCAEYGLATKTLAADARAAIRSYRWPGNVRELSNVVERAALLSDATCLGAADLALAEPDPGPAPSTDTAGPEASRRTSRDNVREHLERVLTETGWNISRTAGILGVSRNTVAARIARFGLRGPRKAGAEPAVGAESCPADPARAPGASVKVARWETRRLTFLRLETAGDLDDVPESRSALLLEVAAEKLRGFGGRVEGLGQRILLATFGMDPRQEHAVLASHSALVIRHALNETAQPAGMAPPKIGLHTAEVPVRLGAGGATIDADASRSAWNAVQSTMGSTRAGAIVATAPTVALIRRRFVVTPLDRDAGACHVDALLRNDAGAPAPRGLFSGRREELALLESRFALAAQGQGQVVAVAGEPGMGKSRLLLELVRSPRLAGAQYLEGRCLPSEIQVPFSPVLQIVSAACGLTDADSPLEIEHKIGHALIDAGPDAEDSVASLTYLLGAKPSPPDIPGAILKRRLFAAIQRLLRARSARSPLVLVVEDLQWVDPTSEACLGAIVESLERTPMLLATTYRTGYQPPWAQASRMLRLTLPPLSAEESLVVIRSVLDGGPCSEELEHRIQAWAEGNPLFLEELSRAARERGDGTLGPTIPATIEDTIETRLGRLPSRLRRLLATAAVIGREVHLPLLRAVAEMSEEAVEAGVGELERAEFLYRSGLGAGEARCAFKHALVQATASAKLAASDRRALHLRILGAIERLQADRLDDHVERLAHHAMLGGALDRAVRYLRDAARKAVGRFALAEAKSHLAKGLELLPRLEEGPGRDRLELALHVASGMVSSSGIGPAAPETAAAFARAAALRHRVTDSQQLGPLLVGQWYTRMLRTDYPGAQDAAEELRGLAAHNGEPVLQVMAHQALGMTAAFLGELVTARRHLEAALDLHPVEQHYARVMAEYGWPIHRNWQRVTCLAYLGRTLWGLGYPDQALARNREAVIHAEGGALNMAIALGMLTSTHVLRREGQQAWEASEKEIAHAGEWGITYWLAHGTVLRSVTRQHALGSVTADAVSDIERALDLYRSTGTTLGLGAFLTQLADAHGVCGQLREGLAAIEQALGLAESTGERYYEAESWRVKAVLLAQLGPDHEAAAEHWFRRALEIAGHQRAKGWELRAATDLARLLSRQKRSVEARGLLAPVYGWFGEGFDTPDLRDACSLLERLDGSS